MEFQDNFSEFERLQRGEISAAEHQKRLATDAEYAADWQVFQITQQAFDEAKTDYATAEATLRAAQDLLKKEGFFEQAHRDAAAAVAGKMTVQPAAAAPNSSKGSGGVRIFSLKNYGWLAAAASLVLVVIAIFLLERLPVDVQKELARSLAERNRSLGFNPQDTSSLMRDFLEQKNADAAVQLFEKNTQRPRAVRLEAGNAYLQKGDFDTAIRHFQSIISEADPDGETAYPARLGLALCHFGKKNHDLANVELKRLKTDLDLPGNAHYTDLREHVAQLLK